MEMKVGRTHSISSDEVLRRSLTEKSDASCGSLMVSLFFIPEVARYSSCLYGGSLTKLQSF